MVLGLGGIFYVSLLLINAIAILNEERFLARGKFTCLPLSHRFGAVLNRPKPSTVQWAGRRINHKALTKDSVALVLNKTQASRPV